MAELKLKFVTEIEPAKRGTAELQLDIAQKLALIRENAAQNLAQIRVQTAQQLALIRQNAGKEAAGVNQLIAGLGKSANFSRDIMLQNEQAILKAQNALNNINKINAGDFGARNARAAAGSYRELGGELAALSPTLGRLAGSAGVVGGIAALVAGVGALGKVGVSYQETLQKLNKSFETLLGSQEAAVRHVKELQEFAARTPFEFEQVAQASQKFLNMGIAAKDVIPILTAVGNAVARTGGGSAQVEAVSRAIAQIGARGKVSAEEMNQLADALVDGWGPLEKALGKTRGELMKMAEQGQISADTFIKAFRAAHEGGDAMKKQMETLSGATSTLTDWTKALLAEGFKPLHALLRDISVELAKNTTEGFNFARALRAMGAAAKDAMELASPFAGPFAGGALGFPFAQLSMWAEATKPKGKEGATGGGINIPEHLRYKPRISDEDLLKGAKERMERARTEEEREAEAARKKSAAEAEREAERQAGVVRKLADEYAHLSSQIKHFNDSEVEQKIAVARLNSGVESLTGSYRKQAEVLLAINAQRMRTLDAQQKIKEAQEQAKKDEEELRDLRDNASDKVREALNEQYRLLLGQETQLEKVNKAILEAEVRGAIDARTAAWLRQLAIINEIAAEVEKTAPKMPEDVPFPQAPGQEKGPWVDPGEFEKEYGPPPVFDAHLTAINGFKEAATGAFRGITEGFGSMLQAFLEGGDLSGRAFLKMAKSVIAGIAAQAAVKAIFELAEGWAALANPLTAWQAPLHFTAAKIYGLVAGAAAVGALAIPGGKGGSSGGGGYGSAGQGAGSFYDASQPNNRKFTYGSADSPASDDLDRGSRGRGLVGAPLQRLIDRVEAMQSEQQKFNQNVAGTFARMQSIPVGQVVAMGAEAAGEAISVSVLTHAAENHEFRANLNYSLNAGRV